MSERMPKVDINKLSDADQEFIRRVKQINEDRVAKLKRYRRNNWITLGVLSTIAVSIYGYTIYSIRQETFLDDFEEPAKIIGKPSSSGINKN